jgi:hypothetical protein
MLLELVMKLDSMLSFLEPEVETAEKIHKILIEYDEGLTICKSVYYALDFNNADWLNALNTFIDSNVPTGIQLREPYVAYIMIDGYFASYITNAAKSNLQNRRSFILAV